MTPTRTSAKGRFRFDRVIQGIGGDDRLQVTSGARTLKEFRRREGILNKLIELGRLDILRALKPQQGRRAALAMSEVVEADRRERLSSLSVEPLLVKPLWATARATIRAMGIEPATKKQYRDRLAALERSGALPSAARVSDLASIDWRELEAGWGRSPAHWNQLRRAVSRFLTVLLGDEHHPFRRDLLKGIPARVEIDREPDFTPAAFHLAMRKLDPVYRPYIWALIGTGTRGGELWGLEPEDLMPLTHGIRVRRKLKNRWTHRVIELEPTIYDWVKRCVPAAFSRDTVRRKWYAACRAAKLDPPRLHDLRHCHGQWTLDAGVPDADVQAQLGHQTAYMTRRYRKRAQRRATSEAIARVLGVPRKVPQRKIRRKGA